MEENEKNRLDQPAEQPETKPASTPEAAPAQPFPASAQSPAPPVYQPFHAPPLQPDKSPQPGPVPERRRSFIGPLILIFLGVMLLLNNLGLVGWSIWEILWRFWPVWLIAIGVDMLFGRRGRWGGLLALAILLTTLGGVFYYVGNWTSNAVAWSQPAAARQEINQPLEGVREARVVIRSGLSRLQLRGGADAESLLQGSITPLAGERIEQEFRSGAAASYTLQSQFNGVRIPFNDGRGSGQWDLYLNGEIPLALDLETGVGRAEIDLTDLQITDLRIAAGVGETEVVLPASGQLQGRIQTGVGQTTLRIPNGMGARIRVQTGIGGVSVRGDFVHDGDYYTTANYSSAANRIDLLVEGGVGGILIEAGR